MLHGASQPFGYKIKVNVSVQYEDDSIWRFLVDTVELFDDVCCTRSALYGARSSSEQTDRQRPECDGIEAASVSVPVCGSLLPPVTTSASLLINIGPSCIVSPRPSDLICDQRPSHYALSRHRLPAYDWRTVRRLPYDQLQRLKQSVGASDKTTTV